MYSYYGGMQISPLGLWTSFPIDELASNLKTSMIKHWLFSWKRPSHTFTLKSTTLVQGEA
jgi:hypothetical protein